MHALLGAALLLAVVSRTQAFLVPEPGRLQVPGQQQHQRPTHMHGRARHAPLRMSTTLAPPEKETNAETVMWLRGLTNTFDGQR
jgi:hypothetical protein